MNTAKRSFMRRTFYLPRDLVKQLLKTAEAEDRPVSRIVRRALENYLKVLGRKPRK